jgi:hypothetical protein
LNAAAGAAAVSDAGQLGATNTTYVIVRVDLCPRKARSSPCTAFFVGGGWGAQGGGGLGIPGLLLRRYSLHASCAVCVLWKKALLSLGAGARHNCLTAFWFLV